MKINSNFLIKFFTLLTLYFKIFQNFFYTTIFHKKKNLKKNFTSYFYCDYIDIKLYIRTKNFNIRNFRRI